MEDFEVQLMQSIPQANLQLPDPTLYDYYNDLKYRLYYFERELTDGDNDIVKFIMRCNIEDYNKPIEERKPIIIAIDSNGGSVFAEQAIVSAIKASKTPVATFNMCNAYSAAAIILANGHKGLRFALKNTSSMFHVGYKELQGTNTQVASSSKFLDKIDKKNLDLIYESTTLDKQKKNKIKSGEDMYFYDQEMIDNGIVDFLIDDIDQIFEVMKLNTIKDYVENTSSEG